MRHESFREMISMLFNWCIGGSLKEMYCARCWRERKMDNVYYLNWFYFILSGSVDNNHCKRVSENGSK